MMRNSIFDLENGGRLIHEVDLYTSKYGIHVVFVGSLLSLSGFAQGHWLATGHFILICHVFSTIMKGKVVITLETTTKTVIILQNSTWQKV